MSSQGAVALFLFALPVALGCAGEGEQQAPAAREGKIVRVGDAVLTETDLEYLLPEDEKAPFTFDEKKFAVERWINQEVLYQKALSRGLGDDPRVRARLRSLEREFLADDLVFRELRDRTWVSEDEIEEYFEQHRNEYIYEYRVSHILVNTLEEAEEVKQQLETKSFAWVANRYSIDPVAKRGGDLGYLTKGNMIPEFESVIFGMDPGEISDIVKSDFGYHVVQLVGVREAQVKVGLEDVREQIMNSLMMERREKAYRELLASLKAAADVEYLNRAYVPDSATAGEADAARDSAAGQ